jgi:hypothetical protein
MADDGVTTETGDNKSSEGTAEETDSSGDDSAADTCDECGAPMTSEVVDFEIAENSRWAEMGGAGDVQYALVCSNEDCPTNRRDGEPEREPESQDTGD